VSELTHDDDGFHEIQLSGKQLVFLFMATTVVSVVIFLTGVLVGRQVRAEDIGMNSTMAEAASPTPPPDVVAAPGAQPIAEDPPAPASDRSLTYAERLQRDKAPAEDLKPRAPAPRPADASRTADASRREPEPPQAEPVATAAPPTPPAAAPGARPGTWAVQVVSLRDRGAASKIVQRLSSKGFPAFLVAPTPGAPAQIYKVQVGRYGDRLEAQRISDRLKKEEQFDPWIIR
jgi:cell division septation protein DedD